MPPALRVQKKAAKMQSGEYAPKARGVAGGYAIGVYWGAAPNPAATIGYHTKLARSISASA